MVHPFVMPGVVYVGTGALDHLGREAARLGFRHSLMVTDPGIVAAGLHRMVIPRLEEAGVRVDLFAEVEPEPSEETVEKAAAAAGQHAYDSVIGLGGGSSLDVAKAVAVLVTNGGSIRDYVGIDKIGKPGLPTVLIPTTAGTGSEATQNAIFTFKADSSKKGVVSRYLTAAVAIVDPELTMSAPPFVTATAGMDALVHAIESYTALRATPHTDIYALEAVRIIGKALRRAVLLGGDKEARSQMVWGSFFAGVALANAGVGAVHALAYPLGGKFRVPHGLANTVMLPYVMEANLPANLEKYLRLASALGQPVEGLSARDAAFSAVEAVRQLIRDIGLPQRLSELGVGETAVPTLVEGAVEQTRLLTNNPRMLARQDIEKIYRSAL